MSDDRHFGLTGLAVMGANLARNVARHGVPVAVHNRTTAGPRSSWRSTGPRARSAAESTEDFVAALETPRVRIIMVKAGRAGRRGDRGAHPAARRGRHHHRRGQLPLPRHQAAHRGCAGRASAFMGVGVSGGEEGALNGPSIMPGGDREAYDAAVKPIFDAIAANVDGTPCCDLRRRRRGGPLRQDGPQRHRVRRHAAHRRGVRPAAPRRWARRPADRARSSSAGTRASSSRSSSRSPRSCCPRPTTPPASRSST